MDKAEALRMPIVTTMSSTQSNQLAGCAGRVDPSLPWEQVAAVGLCSPMHTPVRWIHRNRDSACHARVCPWTTLAQEIRIDHVERADPLSRRVLHAICRVHRGSEHTHMPCSLCVKESLFLWCTISTGRVFESQGVHAGMFRDHETYELEVYLVGPRESFHVFFLPTATTAYTTWIDRT